MSWTCPICERRLKHANQWHSCVDQDIDGLFENKAEELIYIFDQLLVAVADWDNVHVSATKKCVVFVTTQTFLVIKPMKKCLNVKFYSTDPIESPRIFKTTTYGKRLEYHVRLSHVEEVDNHLLRLLKKSYDLFPVSKPTR